MQMQYRAFIDSLDQDACPNHLSSPLKALWYDKKGQWDRAHEIVQQRDDRTAARIHAYLHRKEGDDWNARYWHRRAGSIFPETMKLEDEWNLLVRELTA
jgi:hypothetical protein